MEEKLDKILKSDKRHKMKIQAILELIREARIDELGNWTYCGAEADEIKERIAQLKKEDK